MSHIQHHLSFLLIPFLILAFSGCAKVEVDPTTASANATLSLPTVPPPPADCDNDGLTDDDEAVIGTQKDMPDTDSDGLKDGVEINKYSTDPLRADTDRDGLTDGAEVNSFNTDPTMEDTDSGGQADGVEISKGKNPLLSTDDFEVTVVYICK